MMKHLSVKQRYFVHSMFWTLALFLAAAAVNLYYINKLVMLETGIWLPPLNFRYQFDVVIMTLREQVVLIVGLIAVSFAKPFYLACKDKSTPASERWLSLSLMVLYLLFLTHQLWLEQEGVQRANHGTFFVLLISLFLGTKAGIVFATITMFSYGLLYHHFQILPFYPEEPYITTLFTETHLFAPIFLAAVVGSAKYFLGQERFSLLSLAFFGVLAESLLSLATLISTWSPPYFFERFTENIIVTPLLMLMLWGLRKYQLERQTNALQLTQQELALVHAELKALRAQINPHFMLNSLSVIHHLIRTQPEEARELILDLSDLFQRTLRAGDFVPLREELEHVRSYLALEQARLTKRLKVHWTILAETKLDVLVPTLILQPIVENAVQHGIAPKPEGGVISIVIQQRAEDICIEVADNGLGFDPEDTLLSKPFVPQGSSLGLKNTDYRLRLLYGDPYKLELSSTAGVGTSVILRIPGRSNPAYSQIQHALSASNED